MPTGKNLNPLGDVAGKNISEIVRKCTTCFEEKSGNCFRKQPGDFGRLYLSSVCVSCMIEKEKDKRHAKRDQMLGVLASDINLKKCGTCGEIKPQTEFFKSYFTKSGWSGRCRECKRLKRTKNRTKAREDYHRNWHLVNHYGLSVEDYGKILENQKGVCALCGQLPGKKSLRVDHDHSCCPGEKTCGKCIRGLLCANCNLAMERIDSVTGWAEKATISS